MLQQTDEISIRACCYDCGASLDWGYYTPTILAEMTAPPRCPTHDRLAALHERLQILNEALSVEDLDETMRVLIKVAYDSVRVEKKALHVKDAAGDVAGP